MSIRINQKTIKDLPAFPKISEITLRMRREYYGSVIAMLFWNYKHQYHSRRKNDCFMSIDKDGLKLRYVGGWSISEYDIERDIRTSLLIIDGIDFV